MISHLSADTTYTITLSISRAELLRLILVLNTGANNVTAGYAALDNNRKLAREEALLILEPLQAEACR